MATSFTGVLDHFFADTGFTVTASISSVNYTVVRMHRDDSRTILDAGESDDVAFDILVKSSDVTVAVGNAVTIDSVVYRVKTIHKDGAGLTQRCALVEQYG
jgi:hypothetical protein